MAEVKCRRSNPSQLSGIPGRMGRKLPRIPEITSKKARTMSSRSMIFRLVCNEDRNIN